MFTGEPLKYARMAWCVLSVMSFACGKTDDLLKIEHGANESATSLLNPMQWMMITLVGNYAWDAEDLDSSDPNPGRAEDLIPFSNPRLKPYPNPPKNANSDLTEVPQGLTLFGKLNRRRNIIIHVPGWSPGGQSDPFFRGREWHEKGYNTFTFRWHQDGFDPNLLPNDAEKRLWAKTGEQFYREYVSLIDRLGPEYKGSIWIVGHSLGFQLVAYLVYKLILQGHSALPERIEMLDPYVGINAKVPPTPLFHAPLVEGNDLSRTLEVMLTEMNRKNIVLVFHSSCIGWLTTQNLWKLGHLQEYSYRWMHGIPAVRHNGLKPAFYRTIGQAPLKVRGSTDEYAISAVTSTEMLRRSSRLHYMQVSGLDTLSLDDDEFVRRP